MPLAGPTDFPPRPTLAEMSPRPEYTTSVTWEILMHAFCSPFAYMGSVLVATATTTAAGSSSIVAAPTPK